MILAIVLLISFILILTCCNYFGLFSWGEGFCGYRPNGTQIREEPGVHIANNAPYPYWHSERELAFNSKLGYMQSMPNFSLTPLEVQVVAQTVDGINNGI